MCVWGGGGVVVEESQNELFGTAIALTIYFSFSRGVGEEGVSETNDIKNILSFFRDCLNSHSYVIITHATSLTSGHDIVVCL